MTSALAQTHTSGSCPNTTTLSSVAPINWPCGMMVATKAPRRASQGAVDMLLAKYRVKVAPPRAKKKR